MTQRFYIRYSPITLAISSILLSTLLIGCSQAKEAKPENSPTNTTHVETQSKIVQPTIIALDEQIDVPLAHTPFEFIELRRTDGYFPYYPQYRFLESFDYVRSREKVPHCVACYNKFDDLYLFKEQLKIPKNKILLLGVNHAIGDDDHLMSFSDDYQLRAANDLAINYIRYKKADPKFLSSGAKINYDFELLEQSLNILTTDLSFNTSYISEYNIPIQAHQKIPQSHLTYDDSNGLIQFRNFIAGNPKFDFRLEFDAKAPKQTLEKIFKARQTLFLGYILGYKDQRVSLENIIIYKDVDRNHKKSGRELVALLDPQNITYQRFTFDSEIPPEKKVSVQAHQYFDFKFGLENYTPIEEAKKPFDE